MRKMLMLFVLVPCFLLLMAPSGAGAQDQVPEDQLKKKFFESLKRPQIVSLLETLDRTHQHTDFELGAKYRWGYIPPDRRPPVSLARWWQSKSQRQRSDLREEWFHNHYDQLNLDRSARELGLIDRLNRLHRELQSQLGDKPGELEPVKFPGDTPDPSMSVSGNTEYQPVFRQEADAAASQTRRDTSNSAAEETNGSSGDRAVTDSDREESPESVDSTETDNSAASEQSDRDRDQNVRYRRVGDRIEVIERTPDEPSQPDTIPASSEQETAPEDRSVDDTAPASPNLQLNNVEETSSPMRLDEPSLRSRSNRIPELRRPVPGKR